MNRFGMALLRAVRHVNARHVHPGQNQLAQTLGLAGSGSKRCDYLRFLYHPCLDFRVGGRLLALLPGFTTGVFASCASMALRISLLDFSPQPIWRVTILPSGPNRTICGTP